MQAALNKKRADNIQRAGNNYIGEDSYIDAQAFAAAGLTKTPKSVTAKSGGGMSSATNASASASGPGVSSGPGSHPMTGLSQKEIDEFLGASGISLASDSSKMPQVSDQARVQQEAAGTRGKTPDGWQRNPDGLAMKQHSSSSPFDLKGTLNGDNT